MLWKYVSWSVATLYTVVSEGFFMAEAGCAMEYSRHSPVEGLVIIELAEEINELLGLRA